jgi:hypothetical protein
LTGARFSTAAYATRNAIYPTGVVAVGGSIVGAPVRSDDFFQKSWKEK